MTSSITTLSTGFSFISCPIFRVERTSYSTGIQAQVRVRALGNRLRQFGLHGLGFLRRMCLWPRDRGRTDVQKLNEVLRKDQVKRPVQGHAEFLFEPWELAKVDRTPEPPGDKSREVNAQDVGYTGPPADRCELRDGRKIKPLLLRPANGRDDVMRRNLALAQRVLRGRRMKLTRQSIRDGRTITQSPDTGPALELKKPRHKQAAAFLRARNRFEQRIRGSSCRPNERVRKNHRSVSQSDRSARKAFDLCLQVNLDLAPCEDFLSVNTQPLLQLRQDNWSGMDKHDSHHVF